MKSNEEFLALVNEKAEIKKAMLSKKNKLVKRVTATALAFAIVLSTVLISAKFSDENDLVFDGIRVEALDESLNLTENLSNENKPKATVSDIDEETASATDFAFDLLRAAYNGDNILISPYSVYMALAMTANGADGKTKAEIEEVLGMNISDINEFLLTKNTLAKGYGESNVKAANSIWFRNNYSDFTVNKNYLLTLKNYYDAEAFAAPFDGSTVKDINSWVSDNTDGMIDNMVDSIPTTTVIYLINTVLFEALWSEPFYPEEIFTKTFYSKNGTETETEFLYRSETKLWEFDNAYGASISYSGGGSFLAILPNKDVSIEEFIDSLTSETFNTARNRKSLGYSGAEILLPEFEAESKLELVNSLQNLGMNSAFTSSADFSNITDSDIYISSIFQKTKLKLDRNGTKAAAATSVRFDLESGIIYSLPFLKLTFDRPFVYMILDRQGFPIFIGTLENYGK